MNNETILAWGCATVGWLVSVVWAIVAVLLLNGCVTVTHNNDCDAGPSPYTDAGYVFEQWVGVYDGPVYIVDDCTHTERVYNLTVTVTSFGTVGNLCDLQLEPTGEGTARLLEGRCVGGSMAHGWARVSERVIYIDGTVENECAPERWLFSGLRR